MNYFVGRVQFDEWLENNFALSPYQHMKNMHPKTPPLVGWTELVRIELEVLDWTNLDWARLQVLFSCLVEH